MFELPAAKYPAPRSGLNYELPVAIQLPHSSCVFLQGDNGAGKTSFLEEVLVPKIHKAYDLLYLAQDIEIQQTTMIATLALLNQPVPNFLPDLITAWIKAATRCQVLILDEIDKYFKKDLDQAMTLSRFSLVLTVSHINLQAPYRSMQHGYALRFQRNHVRTVTLSLEHLW